MLEVSGMGAIHIRLVADKTVRHEAT